MLDKANKAVFSTEGTSQQTSKVLFQEGDLTISREHEFTAEIIKFLDDTTWGTTDTLYEHKKTEERVAQLQDPVLATIRIDGELGSMVVIERRKLLVGGREIKGYFFRYLVNQLPFRKRRLFGVYSQKVMELIVADELDEALFYASVEAKNHRSQNFLRRLGYLEQATVSTLGYSRFFPRRDPRMERVGSDEKEQVLQLLKKRYSQHALVHFSYIFQNDDYFVLKENGEIIAGCQAHPATWVVKNIPGKLGGLFLRWVPYIPFVRSVFNPNNFKFLTFEGIYVKEGRERDLVKLFESILHHFPLKACLIWLDIKDPLYEKLVNIGRHGLMKNFVDNASIKILAIPEKASEFTMEYLQSNPVYMSTFDFI
ncbi:MAG: hypothetical protein KDC53_03485 [Saprospiraceae bacterium]|nr:hypothetical protein [Saprospiraceae bacterium]